MKLRAVVAINAEYSDFDNFKKYLDSDTLIVGCDGGANFLEKVGIKPDVIVGDMDSLKNVPDSVLNSIKQDPVKVSENGINYIVYPKDKDKLDSELAIDYCLEQSVNEIICYGILGNRLDHIIGNVFLLTKQKYKNVNLKFIDQNQEVYLIESEVIIHGSIGDVISFIPIDGFAKVISSSGLKYDPSKYEMSTEKNIGISNELTKKEASIKIKKGRFLVIHRKTKSF